MTNAFQSRMLAQRALMHRLRQQQHHNPLQAGFTLIELLIVVIIIGVLASIALPAFLNQQDRARVEAANAAAMGGARSCAALQVTGQHDTWAPTPDLDPGSDCTVSGTETKITSNVDQIGTQAVATITSDGQVSLTTRAAK